MKFGLISKSRYHGFLFILTSVGAFFAFRAVGSQFYPRQEEEPLSLRGLEFGLIETDRPFRWDVTIVNHSANDVIIEKVRTGCDCTSVMALESSPLPAHGTRELELSIDVSKYHVAGDSLPKDFSSSLSIDYYSTAADGSKKETVAGQLTGRIVATLRQSHFQLSFSDEDVGRWETGGLSYAKKSVLFSSAYPIDEVDLAECPRELLNVEVRQHTPFEVELLCSPISHEPLKASFTVNVLLRQAASVKTCQRSVQIDSSGRADLHANPPRVFLGFHPLNSLVTASVVINSRSRSEFQVVGIDHLTDGDRHIVTERGPGAACLDLQLKVRNRGEVMQTIVAICTKSDSAEIFKLPIVVSYIGGAP